VFLRNSSPDLLEQVAVGRTFNTRLENNKLKAEAWLDVIRLANVAPDALSYIRQKKPMDVSAGVFTDDEPTSGDFNGEQYNAIARNHRPDHLALLPGERGACSWADGCGVRTNKEGGILDKDVDALIQTLKAGYREIGRNIQSALDGMDTETVINYLEEVFDGYYVYRQENREVPNGAKHYKVNYTVDGSNNVITNGDPVEVIKKTDYVAVSAPQQNNDEGGVKTMAKKKPCCPEKVETLIQSDVAVYTEEDREFLEGLDEAQMDKLIQINSLAEKKEEPKQPMTMSSDEIKTYIDETLKDPEQFTQFLPAEMKEQMDYGLQMYKAERKKIIDHVLTNSDIYTEEELTAMKMEPLVKIGKLVKAPVDYSMFGLKNQEPQLNQSKEEPMLPTGMDVSE
jgi:hypothetical protein